MKRIQLFEFEDFSLLPNFMRTSITNLLAVLHKMVGTSHVLGELLLETRAKYSFTQIADMGSGSGGVIIDATEYINKNIENESIRLTLTDLHPDPQTVAQINNSNYQHVLYESHSFDATNMSKAPEGLKTMICSFHHMPPEVARSILHSAQKNREPILIFELAENKIPVLVWWIFLPLSLIILFIMAWIMTPFTKSLTWQQLLFTYLIPIIPIAYAWDGQASLVRTYTFKDFGELLGNKRNSTDYSWEIGNAKNAKNKNLGYFVRGIPIDKYNQIALS